MTTIEIYFSDFTEEMQKQILEANHISSPSDANWDVFPITTLDFEDEDEDEEEE